MSLSFLIRYIPKKNVKIDNEKIHYTYLILCKRLFRWAENLALISLDDN